MWQISLPMLAPQEKSFKVSKQCELICNIFYKIFFAIAKLDAVKTYMRMRRVPDHIQTKVIRWFDYLWMTQKSSDEERSVGCLPGRLISLSNNIKHKIT